MRERTARNTLPSVFALLLALTLAPWSAVVARETPATPAAQAARLLAESRDQEKAGDAAAALTLAVEALEYTPDDLVLLDHASACAEAAGDADRALWYARVAAEVSRIQDAKPVDLRAREARVAKLDPLAPDDRPRLDDYAEQVLDVGQYCVRRKLYVNALDFLGRCEGLSTRAKAREAIEKLYDSKKAVQALLDSGIDVPLRDRGNRRTQRMAEDDPRHVEWSKAWKLKGDNYTVVTNMGYEMAESVSDAMEQMNGFYRRVFQYKVGGGNTARCTISLYRNFKEFSRREDEDDPATHGFFVPGENRVAAYDPREHGYPLIDLWETLFHECSHQFTTMLWTGTVPCWIDEGTATYFEGSRLRANGRVDTNLVNESRLLNLKDILEQGRPTLRDTVSWFEDEGYGVEYYPVGWGLVYFLKNYEDEACERVYEPYYDAFLAAYRSGGKHDPFERFVETFVEKPKQPGIDTFEDFEARWRTWILELHDLQFGPPDRADLLRERARREVEAGKLEAAEQNLRWALRKRPGDHAALFDLADLHERRKDKDAALACYRRLLRALEKAPDATAPVHGLDDVSVQALHERCEGRIRELDAKLIDVLAEAGADLRERVAQAAAASVDAGYPRNALILLDRAQHALGGAPDLAVKRREIAASSEVDTWRPRRLPVPAGLAPYEATAEWKAEEGTLVATTDDPAYVLFREPPPASYRFEVTFETTEEAPDALAGLLYGVSESGEWDVYLQNPDGTRELDHVIQRWEPVQNLLAGQPAGGQPFTLAIEVDGGTVTFFADGKAIGRQEYPPSELRGRVGVVAQSCKLVCRDLKLATR